MVFVHLLEK